MANREVFDAKAGCDLVVQNAVKNGGNHAQRNDF
jgi:hypothetical protein